MKTFKEFINICETIAGPLPKPTIASSIASSKIKGPVMGPSIQRPPAGSISNVRPPNVRPQKPSLMGELGRAVNTPVGRFAVNQVLRRMPHAKAASVINAGPVADGTLDAARKRGDLK